MNRHNQIILDSVDSQPFFTEVEEDGNEESQSLISFNNLQSSEVLRANCEIFSDKCDLLDSQPLFTDAKKYLFSDIAKDKKNTTKRKNDNIINQEDSQSSSKKIRSNEFNSSALTIDCDIDRDTKVLESNEEEEEHTEPDSHSKKRDYMPSQTCIECIFDKELDKRNYYFGNLLIGELQFLPPCMRSEAYVTILKYVDSLKQKHRKKLNN